MPALPVNILLVDDEPKNLDALEEMLRQPDYRLVRATSSNEALFALLQQEFALIVLDVQMPEVSGIELADLIKKRERTQHIPIIFLTAFYQDERRMMESYGVGAVDYLTKPVHGKVLKSKVAAFVELHRKNAALAQEVAKREKAEVDLRVANEVLEDRVTQRTAELSTNAARAQLLSELATELLKVEVPQKLLEDHFARIAQSLKAEAYCAHLLVPEAGVFALAAASVNVSAGASEFHAIPATDVSYADVQAAALAGFEGKRGEAFAVAAGGTLLGVFSIVPTAKGALGEAERRFTRTACDLVAASLERARLGDELRRARDKAERAGRAKDEFLAALSHELRTPLNPVLLVASEAAESPNFSEEVRERFAFIRKNVELEARLIDDLLDLTRITHGKLILDLKVHDAHHLLNDAITTVRSEIAQKRIDLRLELTARRHFLEVDGVRLQQVFWNLLRNAVKFTPEGGVIAVRTSDTKDDGLKVTVADSGIGLSKEEIARIFDAFAQGDHAVARGVHRFGGLGLGLTISRGILEYHGGKLGVQSEGPGYGATFSVELPDAKAVGTPAAPAATTPSDAVLALVSHETASTPSQPATPRLRKVLLVEDHEPTRVTLELLLRRRNFEVASSDSLAGARALAECRKFDVLISDIGLPDGSGFDLMEEMKERHGMLGIALTGYGMEEDLSRSQRAGFTVHLTKPIHIRSLDMALAKLEAGGTKRCTDDVNESVGTT